MKKLLIFICLLPFFAHSQSWVNGTIQRLSSTGQIRYIQGANLDSLVRLQLNSLSNLDMLRYNSATGKFIPRTPAQVLSDIGAAAAGSGVTSITGTANQVVASGATGAVTLSLPQSIATSSTPQFAKLGIGAAASTTVNVLNNANLTGGTTVAAFSTNSTIQSGVTGTTHGYLTNLGTAAASFTLTTINHFAASQAAFGAGSTVTNQYGFAVDQSLVGATNNYAFYGNLPAASAPNASWNLYMNGTAVNFLNGNTQIGSMTATAGAEKLQVTGTASISSNLLLGGSLSSTGARVTKGWFTDVESTNMYTVGGTSLASTFAAIAQTMFIGTTSVAINRASATLNLAGIGTLGVGAITGTTANFGGTAANGNLVVKSGESTTTGIVLERASNTNKLVNLYSETGDGKISVASGATEAILLNSAGDSYISGGGLHVGGTSAAGDNNLLVDGTLGINGTADNVKGSTYTPTKSNESNVAALTVNQFLYSRVGNIVTGSGDLTITPTATGAVTFRLTLPSGSTSNFATTEDANGNVSLGNQTGVGAVWADPTNDILIVSYTASSTALSTIKVIFQYIVK